MNNIIVGLDLGTSFVRAVIAEDVGEGRIEIIGTAQRPSLGLRNGIIVNRESAKECIKACIEEAEQKAGYEVYSCVCGIGGMQIESRNSRGEVAIATHGKGPREINQDDIDRVLDSANAIYIQMGRKLLHVIPQKYIIDETAECKNPKGNLAVRLAAEVHLVLASQTAIANMTQCIERSGYTLDGVMLKTLACMYSVMAQDERELGSIIIDLGGGTTDAIVINNDAPICTVSVPVGGNLVTNDIAIVKGVSTATAEKIKIENGCCWAGAMDGDSEVIIPGAGGRAPEICPRSEICLGIIEPRMREIFTMVRDEIMNKANLKLSGNIILTGGGAFMSGAIQLASDVFGTSSVRVGVPKDLGGIQEDYKRPDFATAVGLVQGFVEGQMNQEEPSRSKKKKESIGGQKESFGKKLLKKFF
ncbi:cell division protein FtsA [Treponema pectinovorum]|uniref:cell division protein FtsA n=1 Tax=Treponema pectinovorum TaxID=164 RepID=UPI0011F25F69|nr:cell division protein FtsA [Treponema pectinovorum]